MALTWARLVQIAEQRNGMSAETLRAAIQARGVKTQVLTNWIKGGRPIPVARYPLCASVIGNGLTVDELHGRKVREDSGSYVVHKAEQEDQFLANEISQLGPEIKAAIRTLVELIVARDKREARATKKPRTTRKDDRPNA
jgi:hypothetical protein